MLLLSLDKERKIGMSRSLKRNDIRNIMRQNILRKGYATVTDIRNFIPCGNEYAHELLRKEMASALKENKSTARGINAKRLLKYIGLSIEEINQYADMERALNNDMAELPCKRNEVKK